MRVLRDILNQHGRAAFLIGNGPNLSSGIMPSWEQLLGSAADEPIQPELLEGLSNTEIYDLVQMKSHEPQKVKKKVCELLELGYSPNLSVHENLMQFARDKRCPVLTTNFDKAFETSIGAHLIHLNSRGFTRFYPWKSYYGFEDHRLPTDGFGIWKIHGDINYADSIRLGLTDYMGSAERARRLIHNGDEALFRGKRQEMWKGHQTWLHIWFNMPIVIFGIKCEKDEIFIRWLLIERKRYMNIYGDPMEVYFISKGDPAPEVRNLIRNLDAEIITIDHYSELYG
jgi:hypothetical protein